MQTTAENKSALQISEHHFSDILTPEALEFLVELHVKFDAKRLELLENRKKVQSQFDDGHLPKFPVETEYLRKQDWVAAAIPLDLQDRRVEITGPVDRKMIINALNSGAKTFMADFEDSNSPTWQNNLDGQRNLKDAVHKRISIENLENGKSYSVGENPAVLIVRPRGLHLNEKNFIPNHSEIAGSLFDFGLYFFHNAYTLIANGSGPYFYLPKLEHYEEARWWNEVFVFAQNYLGFPQGTIKATVLIETITASFQLDEIIYELKEHIAGLNCGRWDYIFSYIKKFRNHKDRIVPDRAQVTMNSPFMMAYSQRVIQVCHKRNVLAIGGMAAQIPIKDEEKANELAFEKVRTDKIREVKNGHDGTWVAHPGLVPVALKIFDEGMPTPNQMHRKLEERIITEMDLLEKPVGTITEKGLRENINVGILYLASWLSGKGAAALYHLMEDAATAEISRTQVWQWLHADVTLDNGRVLNSELYKSIRCEEVKKIKTEIGVENFEKGNFDLAIELFDNLVLNKEFEEFLTLEAYQYLA